MLLFSKAINLSVTSEEGEALDELWFQARRKASGRRVPLGRVILRLVQLWTEGKVELPD